MIERLGTVGFVGLGVMGAPMAANLIRQGYPVQAFDLRQEAQRELARRGAVPVGSAAHAATDAELVFVSLPDTPHVETAILATGGVAEGARAGCVVADLSTIAIGATRRIAGVLAARGVGFLDAPVSGGALGAQEGTLSIMVGGAADDYARAEPALRVLGSTVTHVGRSGMGQLFKACNQVVCALNIQALCEAFALARSADADLERLREVLLGGAASSWILEHLGRQMIGGDDRPGFRIALQLKDLRLALEAAFEAGVPLPGAAQVTSLYLGGQGPRRGRQRQSRPVPRLRPHREPGTRLTVSRRLSRPARLPAGGRASAATWEATPASGTATPASRAATTTSYRSLPKNRYMSSVPARGCSRSSRSKNPQLRTTHESPVDAAASSMSCHSSMPYALARRAASIAASWLQNVSSCWASFAAAPVPTGPITNVLSPTASNSGWQRSRSCGSPPAITVSRPSTAAMSPPVIGASTSATPA
jgi:2-hydroxy-3-oxopropionate reductase